MKIERKKKEKLIFYRFVQKLIFFLINAISCQNEMYFVTNLFIISLSTANYS